VSEPAESLILGGVTVRPVRVEERCGWCGTFVAKHSPIELGLCEQKVRERDARRLQGPTRVKNVATLVTAELYTREQ
jgi:hypothetical protein